MKLSKSVMFGAAACLLSTSASAQAAGDLLALSQYNYSFSTARSAALGGAFTSLGADLSSMSINPAGLGMYMSSDFGISPSLTWNNMQSTYLGTKAITRERASHWAIWAWRSTCTRAAER